MNKDPLPLFVEEKVTIDKSLYDALRKDRYMLRCLDANGVDNWDGYFYACVDFEKKYPKEEDYYEEDDE